MEYTILYPQYAIPPRKNSIQQCYEIFSPLDIKIPPLESKLIFSGINLNYSQNNFYVKLECKSDEEENIDVLGGVIDKDYKGDIGVIIYNFSCINEKTIKRGDIIAVARLLKYLDSDDKNEKFEKRNNNGYLPQKMTRGSVGWDIYTPHANTLPKNGIITIDTGINILKPSPFHHIRYVSRSGLASKSSIIVIYGDENGILILKNLSNKNTYTIKAGHRVAQIVYEI